MDHRNSGLRSSFETMRDDKKRRAEEAILGEVNQKTRAALLGLDSYLETLHRKADEDIQAKQQEIDQEFAELIKNDKPLSHLQLMLEESRSNRRSDTDPGVFASRSRTQPPVLRREFSASSSEIKVTAASKRARSPPAERAAPGIDPRMLPTQEHADKKTKTSPGTGRRSVVYDTDSTGDFEEEIPYRVPNPKAPEAVVTPEPEANDNDLGLPSSSTKTIPGSNPSSSLPRPRRCAADRVNYNEKKYFKDLFDPQHKRKCSVSDD